MKNENKASHHEETSLPNNLSVPPGLNNRISEIRGRLEKATKGPWGLVVIEAITIVHDLERNEVCWGPPASLNRENWPANASFIAHAPEDIAYLLKEVEGRASRGESDDLERWRNEARAVVDTYYVASGKLVLDGQDGYGPIRALRIHLEEPTPPLPANAMSGLEDQRP